MGGRGVDVDVDVVREVKTKRNDSTPSLGTGTWPSCSAVTCDWPLGGHSPCAYMYVYMDIESCVYYGLWGDRSQMRMRSRDIYVPIYICA